jgi:hypothetical protein
MCAPDVDHHRLAEELGQALAAIAVEERGELAVRDLVAAAGTSG